ncbi:MAG TPA: hypothetical protein VF773_19560 [Verrucomicrobiae bacterium]
MKTTTWTGIPRNTFAILFLLCAAVYPITAAEKAAVTLTSYSVQILPSEVEDDFGVEWDLALSSVGNHRALNSELRLPESDRGYTHESWFVMDSLFLVQPMVFEVLLDIPATEDSNGNGIPDFYDPAVAIDATTTGLHPDDEGGVQEFTAYWVRGVGEMIGSVYFEMPYFDLTFGHQFNLLHYAGEYSYDRTGNNLQGSIALTNVWNEEDRVLGPLSVEVVNTNTLRLTANQWNNGAGVDYVVVNNTFDDRYVTNFFSDFLLQDGYPLNGITDYVDWFMVISSQDANGNGILDLVETGGSQPGVRPTLSITKTATGFQVTLAGTAGKSYRLESTSDVTAANWPNQHQVTMNGATGVANITTDTTGDVFFRAREI